MSYQFVSSWQQFNLYWHWNSWVYVCFIVRSFSLEDLGSLRGDTQKKRYFLGIFPKGGGGVFSIPKTFVNLPSYFWYAKIILRYQNRFYNSGEVISDQSNHLILIWNLENSLKNRRKREVLGIFSWRGGGGNLFPKVIVRIVTKKSTSEGIQTSFVCQVLIFDTSSFHPRLIWNCSLPKP